MTKTLTYCSAIADLLMAASPLHAGSCAHSIARVQAQVDAVIENRAGSDSPEPESLSALRGYQPTPYSLAETEGSHGRAYEFALDSLGRARAADHVGDTASCLKELANARAVLR
jgi:hypothetical protein